MLTFLKVRVRTILDRLVGLIHFAHITPNMLTISGLLVGATSGIIFAFSSAPHLAASLYLISGLFDVLDGAVAAKFGEASRFGGFLDSLLDRYGDCFIFSGLILGGFCNILVGLAALIGSVLVSYSRARGESLGVEMGSVGLVERAERILVICGASYLELVLKGSISYGVAALAILTHFTVLQRTYHIWKETG